MPELLIENIEINESEDEIYNLTDDSSKKPGISWYSASFIIMNSCLGAGILAFPLAYQRAGGVIVSLILQTILVIPAYITLVFLGRASDLRKTSSYEQTIEVLFGRYGKFFFCILLIAYTYGCCITFLIIIGDMWDRIIFFITDDSTSILRWYFNRKFTTSLTSILICLPLSIPRRIEFLRYASALGVAGIFYIVFLIVGMYFSGDFRGPDIKTWPDQWTDVFLVVPTICFGYQCHICVIPVYATMKDRPNIKYFALTCGVAMAGAMIIYSFVGIFGYWSFGSLLKSDITTNYPPSIPVIIGIIFLCIKTYTTYPILNFTGRLALKAIILDLARWDEEQINRREKKLSLILTCIWFVSSLVIALFIPDISTVIGWLGSLAAVFAYAGPGFVMFRIYLLKRDGYFELESTTTAISINEQSASSQPPIMDDVTFLKSDRFENYSLLVISIIFIMIGSFTFGLAVSISAIDSFN